MINFKYLINYTICTLLNNAAVINNWLIDHADHEQTCFTALYGYDFYFNPFFLNLSI